MNKETEIVEGKECQFCRTKTIIFDGIDEVGHLNYICKICGEPQDD